MSRPPPKSYVTHWWRRALSDGAHCESKRRESYFHEYLEAAEESLQSAGLVPESLRGVFRFWYRRGFRIGYDNALLLRERGRGTLSRRKKRVILRK
jgi:hypothetical protein